MQANDRFRNFLLQCSDALSRQARTTETSEGAKFLTDRLVHAQSRHYTPQTQPVLASLAQLERTDYTFDFHTVAEDIPWQPSSRTTDKGKHTALGAINQMLDLGDLVVGLLYLDSGQQYPLHQHTPQELYMVMAGSGQWRYGGRPSFATKKPGDVLYNHPNDIHGIHAGDSPLLALYLLWP